MDVKDLLSKPMWLKKSPVLRFQEAIVQRLEDILTEYKDALFGQAPIEVKLPTKKGNRTITFDQARPNKFVSAFEGGPKVPVIHHPSVEVAYQFQHWEDQNFSQFMLTFKQGGANERGETENFSFYVKEQGPEETGKMVGGLIAEHILFDQRRVRADIHVRVHEIAYEQGWRQPDDRATVIDVSKGYEAPEHIRRLSPTPEELQASIDASRFPPPDSK